MSNPLSKLLPQSTKNKYHKLRSKFAVMKYGNPGANIKLIGVTGTKGKTTTCNMIASVLDAAGIKNAMETTINTKIGDKVTAHTTKAAWVTTPPASVLQAFLKKAVKEGCEYAVIEVSSGAIDQHRIYGLKFDVVVYTNLSHEHMEYHKDMDDYLNAKLKLFKGNPGAAFVINQDDSRWNKFYSLPSRERFLYSVKRPVDHGVVARKILQQAENTTFTAAYDEGQATISLKMPGVFNISNALAAFAVGLALELDVNKIKTGLENISGVTGRMESIKVSKKQDFSVIVDYAHNADSLKNVYDTIKKSIEKSGGRIIAVLGATGRRDKTKRPIMGALAGGYADMVIFTNEDPYDEDPMQIIEEISAGILKGGEKNQWRLNRNYWKVLDRRQAIAKALREAKKNDVVIITGKGAEEVMAVGLDKFVPFSDRKIAREELAKLFGEDK